MLEHCLVDSPPKSEALSVIPPKLVLAHGAGAPMDSEFMERITALLVGEGVEVIRFEFPYMQERRAIGKRRPPNREPELLASWRELVTSLGEPGALFIGGKSMGGRMASLLADELGVKGLVCLGYPFHPQGKPEKLRTAHLAPLKTPTLVVQGTRDALGNREDVEGYKLSPSIQLHWLEDGDHDLKPRVKSGYSHEQHLQSCASAIAGFMHSL